MNVLITFASLFDKGGVASFYNSVLPFLTNQMDCNISYLEIGSTKGSYKFIHPLIDQIRFHKII